MTGELEVAALDADGRVQILGVTRDVSERKRLSLNSSDWQLTDDLTGAYNRRYANEILRWRSRSSTATDPSICVADRHRSLPGHQ